MVALAMFEIYSLSDKGSMPIPYGVLIPLIVMITLLVIQSMTEIELESIFVTYTQLLD